ncbi:hypothetical protein A5821_003309 [Enterococcus sp. 7F3_DIV0205]|uniref:DUF975 family protein n=1 Tax=Candidatus Enterococcus palustris TaxID=1834189 RepID=A0AAQ3WFR7_9ENTE|nr:DUF975 family protein [Enterococcus sp. 7F3_DIV0205]OTN84191.1 hypothetical protein A5821_000117 [Enterococcus sp. 7F3_DIV0205]
MKSQITNAMHREQARISLKDQWGTMAWITFLAALITMLIGAVVSMIVRAPEDSATGNVITFLLNNFIFFALTYATYYCALEVLRGRKADASMLGIMFQGKFYIPMLLINLIQAIIGAILNLIILLPILLTSGVVLYFSMMVNKIPLKEIQGEATGDVTVALMILLFTILAAFIGVFVSGVFQFAVWVKIDDNKLPVGDTIKYALSLMKGRFGQYFLLQLSFIGWFFIGVLTFGIGLLWVIPYHNVAIASFYDTAREEKGAPISVE